MRGSTALAFFAIALCPSSAFAGSSALGTVTNLTTQTGAMFFTTSGTRSSPPACATVPSRWVVSATTTSDQALIATILSAQAQGRQVQVLGTGTCSISADTETAAFVVVPLP